MATSETATFNLRYKIFAEDIARAKAANQSIIDLTAKAERAIYAEGGTAKDVATKMAALHSAVSDAAAAENRMAAASTATTNIVRRETYAVDAEVVAERAAVQVKEDVVRAQETENRATNDSVDLLDRQRRAVEGVRQAEQKRQGSVSAGVAGRLGQVDRFGRVGGQILGGLGATEAANAVNLVGDVADSFTLLSPPMLAVTAATATLGVILSQVQQQAKKTADALHAQLTTEAEVRRSAADATHEELVQRRDAVQEQLVLERQIAIERVQDLARASEAVGTFGVLLARLGLANGDLIGYNAAVTDQQKIIHDLTSELDALNGQLGSPLIQSLFIVAGQMQEIKDEAFEAGNALKEYNLKMAEQARLAEEAAQAIALANSEKTKEIALAREAAAASAEAIRQQGITDTVDELFEANEAVVSGHIKEAAALKDLTDAQNESLASIAKLEGEAEAERTENIREAADQRIKITEDSQDRINDITRKGARDLLNAIGSRDALAAFNAAQNTKEQIDDEQKAAQKRLRELDSSLQKQNQAVDTRLRERIALEQARGRQEVDAKRAALQQAQVDLQNALNAQRAIQQQYHSFFVSESAKTGFEAGKTLFASFRAGILAEDKSRVNSNFYSGQQQGYFYTAQQFQGTLAPSPTLFTQQQGTTVNFSPQVTGQTAGQVLRQLNDHSITLVQKLFGRSA